MRGKLCSISKDDMRNRNCFRPYMLISHVVKKTRSQIANLNCQEIALKLGQFHEYKTLGICTFEELILLLLFFTALS